MIPDITPTPIPTPEIIILEGDKSTANIVFTTEKKPPFYYLHSRDGRLIVVLDDQGNPVRYGDYYYKEDLK